MAEFTVVQRSSHTDRPVADAKVDELRALQRRLRKRGRLAGVAFVGLVILARVMDAAGVAGGLVRAMELVGFAAVVAVLAASWPSARRAAKLIRQLEVEGSGGPKAAAWARYRRLRRAANVTFGIVLVVIAGAFAVLSWSLAAADAASPAFGYAAFAFVIGILLVPVLTVALLLLERRIRRDLGL